MAVVVAIAWGGWLRLAYLGNDPVLQDELTQYFAAESLNATGEPLLPSGERYERGLDVTRMVALSVDQFGPRLDAIRLPSALFGVLDLVLFAGLLWAVGGGWVAFWGTMMLAIDPEMVAQSRDLRFYTYQIFWGLIALFAGWFALRRAGDPAPRGRDLLARQWAWVLLTLFALLMAARAQATTFSVVAGWGVCVLLAAAADLRALGGRAWQRSVPLQLALAGVGSVVALLVFRADLLARLWAQSQVVPYWAALAGNSVLSYYYSLSESFPLLLALMPLIFVLVAQTRPRLALYLGVWFAVPMALHSLLFPWKGGRFVLLAMPALFAAAAFATSDAAAGIYNRLQSALEEQGPLRRYSEWMAGACVALVALWVVASTPAFNASRKLSQAERPAGWPEVAAIARSQPEFGRIPFGHSSNLEALYFVGALDFTVARSFLADLGSQGEPAPVGSRDEYSGAPVLPTPASIRERFAGEPAVLLGLDTRYIGRDVDPALLEVLDSEARELCAGKCGTMRLYLWPLHGGG